jgi:antitoxin VapB
MNKHVPTPQLNLKGDRPYRLAAKLAELTGESLTAAVTTAIEERLEREELKAARRRQIARMSPAERAAGLMELGRLYSMLPDSGLTEDEILDYDEYGVPRNR